VELEGEMHTCWEQDKLDYHVNPFPVSLLCEVLEVVVCREDKG
jgi:hypothetical protein